MLTYYGDDSAFFHNLQTDFPDIFQENVLNKQDNNDDLIIHSYMIIVLDLRVKKNLPIIAIENYELIILLEHNADEAFIHKLNHDYPLATLYFEPCLYEGVKKRVELIITKNRISYEKRSSLYVPGIENIFNLRASSNKTLEENYLDHIGTFIMILDANRTVYYINNAGCELLGRKKEEIIGKNFIENFIPKTVQKNVNHVAESLVQRDQIQITKYINPIINSKGEEILISWTNSSLLDEKGNPIALLTSGEDISEKYKNEQKIKDNKFRQDALLDALPQYIYLKDKNLNYYAINRSIAAMLHIEPDDAIGKNDYDFFPKALAEKYRRDDRRVMESKEPFEAEESYTKDGFARVAYTMKRPIFDENNEVNGVLGISWDITEKKETERFLLRQQRHAQMGEMISMIAHQWRQPLMNITAITSNVLLQGMLGKRSAETIDKSMQSIENHVMFLSDTINDFRNYFKPDKDKVMTTMSEIIEKTGQLYGAKIISLNISVEKTFEDDPSFSSYKNELIQVFLSLIQNAIDVFVERHTKSPTISIDVRKQDNKLYTVIQDNAGGIEEDLIDKIFEPYFSTKHEQQGTGLGLYMSKSIIEEHCEGSLDAVNEKEGLAFIVVLPLD